jgi:hypothetical protein
LGDLTLAHPTVQPMPEGRILVVGARARWHADGPDRNAVIYGPDGGVLAEATVGDGVSHVQTTPHGNVWVGYFDEGVYGNYGWGGPGAPEPIGSPGLIKYGPDLLPDWHFSPAEHGGVDAIADCYALNLDAETAWVYYYSDFPIVRIHDGRVHGWTTTVSGAKAFITDGHQVAFVGGYGTDNHRIITGVLRDTRFSVTAEYRLTLPDGQPLPATLAIEGRGRDLHVVTETNWYRMDLNQVMR